MYICNDAFQIMWSINQYSARVSLKVKYNLSIIVNKCVIVYNFQCSYILKCEWLSNVL